MLTLRAKPLFNELGPPLQPQAVEALRSWAGSGSGAAQAIASRVGYSLQLRAPELERMPAQGPLILVCKRPDGAVEPCALLPALRRRRPDLLALHAGWLEWLEEGQAFSLGPGPERERMQRAEAHLRQNGALLVFVRSDLAKGRRLGAAARRQALFIARLALMTRASVQALRLEGGRRRPWLRLLGLDKLGFRRRWLGPALPKARPRLAVTLGLPLSAPRLAALGGAKEVAEVLALRCWLLARRGLRLQRALSWRSPWSQAQSRPLASALPPALLEEELERLPAEALLAKLGDLECWVAGPGQAPNLLREIGRLREESFRAVGEGSGQPLDLDRFDRHYRQLFLWQRKDRCVVGGYRFIPTDEALASQGPQGLYTHSLLRFKPELLRRLGPALELGRAFVAPAYQRSHSPLLLLWKGIGTWVSREPRYRRLFGLVSMSDDYQPLSKELLASFMKQHLFDKELSKLTRPRRPYAPAYAPSKHDPLTWRLGSGLEELNSWVKELEPDGKGLPVLFKRYADLGGIFFGFNVDPTFGQALDGLVCIDLLATEPRMLERTMGQAEAARFLAWHSKEAPC